MNSKHFLCNPFYFKSKQQLSSSTFKIVFFLRLRTAVFFYGLPYARQLVSFIQERDQEREDLEATETERIRKCAGVRRCAGGKPKRREGEGKKEIMRVNTRQGKKEGNMMTIIWVWASLGSAIQIARSLSAWCAVRF